MSVLLHNENSFSYRFFTQMTSPVSIHRVVPCLKLTTELPDISFISQQKLFFYTYFPFRGSVKYYSVRLTNLSLAWLELRPHTEKVGSSKIKLLKTPKCRKKKVWLMGISTSRRNTKPYAHWFLNIIVFREFSQMKITTFRKLLSFLHNKKKYF